MTLLFKKPHWLPIACLTSLNSSLRLIVLSHHNLTQSISQNSHPTDSKQATFDIILIMILVSAFCYIILLISLALVFCLYYSTCIFLYQNKENH